jgi:protein TIF31
VSKKSETEAEAEAEAKPEAEAVELEEEESPEGNLVTNQNENPDPVDSLKVEICEKEAVEDSNEKSPVLNKKLSASAAPFNPINARAGPPVNLTVPNVGSWPMNMGLPPVSPMGPYPSPPHTPNIIHSVRFIYPQYSQPQSLHYAWPCNVSPNSQEFIHGPFWPPPMDYTVSQPLVDPVVEHGSDTDVQSDVSPPNPTVEVDEVKEEGNNTELPSVNLPTVNVIENGKNGLKGDNEKTFNILIRGRRNRKQTLRMPISLLKRPYNSQSFKVMYSRVIRGNESNDITNNNSFSTDEKVTPVTAP